MEQSRDVIEFYDGDAVVASVRSPMVPPVGTLINIRKEEWVVRGVTYALDYADHPYRIAMRANVDLGRVTSSSRNRR